MKQNKRAEEELEKRIKEQLEKLDMEGVRQYFVRVVGDRIEEMFADGDVGDVVADALRDVLAKEVYAVLHEPEFQEPLKEYARAIVRKRLEAS